MKLQFVRKVTGVVGLLACLNVGMVGVAHADLVRPEPAKTSKNKTKNAEVGTVLNPDAGAGEVLRIVNMDGGAAAKSKDAKSSKKTASKNQKRKTRSTSARSGSGRAKYASLIRSAARKHGVPVSIAKAVVQVESNFNSRARGSVGEVGLMQIRPSTARGMGYRGSVKALYNPETNLEWGMKYLAGAYKRAGGDVCGTILRYNAGHYAKRMNPISRRYCQKVKSILRNS